MTTSSIPRFVVILDQEGARSDVAEVASAAIRGGADIVQLREKSLPEARVAEIARRIISAVEDPLRVAINGSPAIAAELGTHLHLPEAMTVRRNELHLAAGAMLRAADWLTGTILAFDYDRRPYTIHQNAPSRRSQGGEKRIVAPSSPPWLSLSSHTT